jgi:hypothetical protein
MPANKWQAFSPVIFVHAANRDNPQIPGVLGGRKSTGQQSTIIRKSEGAIKQASKSCSSSDSNAGSRMELRSSARPGSNSHQ